MLVLTYFQHDSYERIWKAWLYQRGNSHMQKFLVKVFQYFVKSWGKISEFVSVFFLLYSSTHIHRKYGRNKCSNASVFSFNLVSSLRSWWLHIYGESFLRIISGNIRTWSYVLCQTDQTVKILQFSKLFRPAHFDHCWKYLKLRSGKINVNKGKTKADLWLWLTYFQGTSYFISEVTKTNCILI